MLSNGGEGAYNSAMAELRFRPSWASLTPKAAVLDDPTARRPVPATKKGRKKAVRAWRT